MKKLFLILSSILIFSSARLGIVLAQECGGAIPEGAEALTSYIKNCSDKLNALQGQKKTLSTTINYINSQISLTQAQISQTQQELDRLNLEIEELNGKIISIDYSLDDLTKLFISRIQASYKQRVRESGLAIFSANGFADFFRRLEYVKKVRDHDREIMIALEASRLDYDNQKKLKEEKQAEVEALQTKLQTQKNQLALQKQEQEVLLITAKNDEKRYQELLNKAQAELIAIQAVIAGKGTETEVGPIGEGERIATIIAGASACSSGSHLHFEVVRNQSHLNPFEYLRSNSLNWDNADTPQNGTGDWRWPMHDPIRITQGYGQTSYSSIYANNIHTGVDMVNSENYNVLAVKPGKLFRGSIACGGGTLRYVRVDHDGSDYDTYYLHVNY